jgi:SEC-C motif-containing protein
MIAKDYKMTTISEPCPCCSGKPYTNCCQKYHQGVLPETALALMRSRYCAYARGIADYLIESTHSQSPHVVSDKKQWLYQIRSFSKQVSFDGLEILETQLVDAEAFVTFVAHLSKEGVDLTFTEKSRFLKEGQAWKYLNGKIAKGRLTAAEIKKI